MVINFLKLREGSALSGKNLDKVLWKNHLFSLKFPTQIFSLSYKQKGSKAHKAS